MLRYIADALKAQFNIKRVEFRQNISNDDKAGAVMKIIYNYAVELDSAETKLGICVTNFSNLKSLVIRETNRGCNCSSILKWSAYEHQNLKIKEGVHYNLEQ